MRRVSTGIEQLLTSEAIADAVITYATVLARAESADTVIIPIVREDGEVDTARLLLGPASQMTIVPDGAEVTVLPGEEAIVRDIEARTARLEPRSIPAEPSQQDVDAAFPDFEEFD